jgi:hypothetical protein
MALKGPPDIFVLVLTVYVSFSDSQSLLLCTPMMSGYGGSIKPHFLLDYPVVLCLGEVYDNQGC